VSLDDVWGRRAARREALHERPTLPWGDDKYPLALELPARVFADNVTIYDAVGILIRLGEVEVAEADGRKADPEGTWERFIKSEPTKADLTGIWTAALVHYAGADEDGPPET
jgi:hypothetical protein